MEVDAQADSKDSSNGAGRDHYNRTPRAEGKSTGGGLLPRRSLAPMPAPGPGQGLAQGPGQGPAQGQGLPPGLGPGFPFPTSHQPRPWHSPSDHPHRLMMHEHIVNILRESFPEPQMYQYINQTSQECNNELYHTAQDFHDYTNVPALPARVRAHNTFTFTPSPPK